MKERCIVDFHAHILPGADHGSDCLETTEKQLKLLKKAGVEKVVATPHFYPQRDSVQSFLERRDKAVEELKKLTEDRPTVMIGAEVLVCPGIDHMPELEKLCIQGTDILLLEMPFSTWRREHIDAVRKIIKQGYTVIMAHIDRYSDDNIGKLSSEVNVLYQINGEVITSLKGRKKLKRICTCLPVAAVGSDIHMADKKAVKRLLRLCSILHEETDDIADTSMALLASAYEV
ncbi:MAG: hypothetical protein IJF69_02805 [Clostridia bacterium]|nr:hypothetical protein [Clostridia bacterium]